MDNLEKIFEFTKKSELLKQTKRWGNTPQMVNKETSAAHSWHLALLVPIVAKELNLEVDVSRAVLVALVHDIVEALAGDIDFSLIATGKKTKKQKHDGEVKAIAKIKKSLPEKSGKIISDLWYEYEKAETREAKFVKALDKIEAINHMVVIGMECYDHPDFIAPYPNKAVKNFPELMPMLKKLHDKLKPAFKKLNWPWKPEYDNY